MPDGMDWTLWWFSLDGRLGTGSMRQDSSLKHSSAQWLSSQLALFTGVLFALLLLMAIVWMSWRGHQQVVEQDLRQQELYARVIEDLSLIHI